MFLQHAYILLTTHVGTIYTTIFYDCVREICTIDGANMCTWGMPKNICRICACDKFEAMHGSAHWLEVMCYFTFTFLDISPRDLISKGNLLMHSIFWLYHFGDRFWKIWCVRVTSRLDVCVHAHMYMCLYTRMHFCVRWLVCSCTQVANRFDVCVHVHIYTYLLLTQICLYVPILAHTQVCLYTHTYTHTNMSVHTHTGMSVYIHTNLSARTHFGT